MDKIIYSRRPAYKLFQQSLRKELVREYLTTDCSKAYLMQKYGVRSRNTITRWIEEYGNSEYLSGEKQPKITSEDMTEEAPDIKKLQERIRQLERELEDSKLLAEAYARMIKAAEEQLKIPIRKKYNTK